MKSLTFILSLIGSVLLASGQGLLLNKEKAKTLPQFSAADYGFAPQIPTSYSLRKYCPTPSEQQGNSCVGFAVGYAALSIMYSKEYGTTIKNELNFTSFDPYYIYTLLREQHDFNCNIGTYMADAIDILMNYGIKRSLFPPILDCMTDVDKETFLSSLDYSLNFRIKDAYYLINESGNPQILQDVKNLLYEGYPLPVGITLTQSMLDTASKVPFGKSGLWEMGSNDANDPVNGHAMCVVGFDDYKYGGSFELMNSWGQEFGDKGFIWIKYADFLKLVKELYVIELYDYSKNECIFGNCYNQYSRYKFDTGEIYEGELQNGKFNGIGFYVWNNGELYWGTWNNALRNGTGFFVGNDGKMYLCNYANDILTESKEYGFAPSGNDEKLQSVINYFDKSYEAIEAKPGMVTGGKIKVID